MAAIELIRDRNQAPITIRDDDDHEWISQGVVHGQNPTDGAAARTTPESLRQATELDGAQNKVANVAHKADTFAARQQDESKNEADRIGTPGRSMAASGQQGYFLSPLERLRQMRGEAGDEESPTVPGWA